TRLILLQADAGQVIDAFGTFVVQGDYVVGAVVFLIITLVQFLVIARGSERVAEVSARFTLDAMPGRQMAIDADLRAGALTLEQARQQREELQLESRLYGALDGAMKFVKGDAIAGLLITAINIVGGLAIGVLQRGLPIDQAARTYTLLTIGDGLVSQIPALLIATAAGLIVTRVGVGSSNLGSDAAGQILRHPRALGITAAFLALLALVPGLPTVPFAILALLAAGLAWRAGDMGSEAEDGVALGVAAPMVQPLRLVLGSELVAHLGDAGMKQTHEAMATACQALYREQGLPVPPVQWGYNEIGWTIRIEIDEIPALDTQAAPGYVLTDGAEALLDVLGLTFVPVTGYATRWFEAEQAPELTETALPLPQAIARLASDALKRHGSLLLGIQEVQGLLDQLREVAPADVEAVVPGVLSVPELTRLLRMLLDASISIRNLRIILMAIAEHQTDASEPLQLLSRIRVALRRQITHTFASRGTLHAWLVEREVEHMIRDALARRDADGLNIKMAPTFREAIQQGARRVAEDSLEHPTLVLTERDVRPFLHAMICDDIPGLVTLSYAELTPETHVKPLGHLSARTT
ncbi:MAG: flagellar biosynthesis protein FlhA, partial [Myxococcota bacterium]